MRDMLEWVVIVHAAEARLAIGHFLKNKCQRIFSEALASPSRHRVVRFILPAYIPVNFVMLQSVCETVKGFIGQQEQ